MEDGSWDRAWHGQCMWPLTTGEPEPWAPESTESSPLDRQGIPVFGFLYLGLVTHLKSVLLQFLLILEKFWPLFL